MMKKYDNNSLHLLIEDIKQMTPMGKMGKYLFITCNGLKARLNLSDIKMIVPFYYHKHIDDLIIHTHKFSEITIKVTPDLQVEIWNYY